MIYIIFVFGCILISNDKKALMKGKGPASRLHTDVLRSVLTTFQGLLLVHNAHKHSDLLMRG